MSLYEFEQGRGFALAGDGHRNPEDSDLNPFAMLVPFNQVARLDGPSRLGHLPIHSNSPMLADLLGQGSPENETRSFEK